MGDRYRIGEEVQDISLEMFLLREDWRRILIVYVFDLCDRGRYPFGAIYRRHRRPGQGVSSYGKVD